MNIETLTMTKDIRQEPLINEKWSFAKNKTSQFADGIFITGANSYIGCHVFNLLQEKWPGKIYLLVRATNEQEATDKMSAALKTWKLDPIYSSHVSVLTGDVSEARFGLDMSIYNKLKKNTGMVLHMAMNPMYNLTYEHFERLWVPELKRMIKFCGDAKHPKSLHYPSSYNADFFMTDEDFSKLESNAWQSGYAGFKWVANKALKNAFDQNLQGCIYDIPLVLGSLKKGVCPLQYSIWYILDMFLKAKCYIPFEFKIIPVDVLSKVIVHNLLNDKSDKGERFLRPALKKPVSDKYFGNVATNLLGIKKSNQQLMRTTYRYKEKFDFVFPDSFYPLLERVNRQEAIFPKDFNTTFLPSTMLVFLSNLNKIISKNKIK